MTAACQSWQVNPPRGTFFSLIATYMSTYSCWPTSRVVITKVWRSMLTRWLLERRPLLQIIFGLEPSSRLTKLIVVNIASLSFHFQGEVGTDGAENVTINAVSWGAARGTALCREMLLEDSSSLCFCWCWCSGWCDRKFPTIALTTNMNFTSSDFGNPHYLFL